MGNKSEDDLIARVNYAHNHHCNVTDFPIGLIYFCYNKENEELNNILYLINTTKYPIPKMVRLE